MSNSELLQFAWTDRSNMSRRHLLRRLGAAGLAAAAMYPARQGLSVGNLQLWGLSTLNIPEAWKQLEKEKNIRIGFEDNRNDPGPVLEKLIQRGQSLSRHVSALQGGAEAELARNRVIVPWDISRISNFGRSWKKVLNLRYTKVAGEQYGIPTAVNADSIIYRPDLAGPVDSYEAVFDPILAGKTAMEDAWINSVIMAAIYLKENSLQTIQDPGDLTETELKGVMGFLSDKARAGQFKSLWDGPEDAIRLIRSGEVYVMTGWEPIAIEAQRQGINARYAKPREGYEGWSNDLLLHPGAEKDGLYDAAHEFANWELDGCYGCHLASRTGYAVPNDRSLEYARNHQDQFDLLKIQSITDRVNNKIGSAKYWQNVMPNNRRLYEEHWSKFRKLVFSKKGK